VTDTDWYGGDTLCAPENYDALHERFVSKETQESYNQLSPNIYRGYRLQIPPTTLIQHFKRVE